MTQGVRRYAILSLGLEPGRGDRLSKISRHVVPGVEDVLRIAIQGVKGGPRLPVQRDSSQLPPFALHHYGVRLDVTPLEAARFAWTEGGVEQEDDEGFQLP